MKPPRLLGTTEVCRRLRIDKSTLTRWVDAGRIERAQKLPGRNGASLYEESEVVRLEREAAGGRSTVGDQVRVPNQANVDHPRRRSTDRDAAGAA